MREAETKVPWGYLILTLLVGGWSCSGPVVKEGKSQLYEIRRVDLTRVRFFRPSLEPVSPGDLDESPRRDENRICVRPENLWSGLLAEDGPIRECLNGIKTGLAAYRLKKGAELELVYEPESDGHSSCLSRVLPRIPLPREIYFHAETEPSGGIEVLSLSLDPKTRSWFDWDFLTPRPRIRFPVPPTRTLRASRDLEAWLLTWVFSLFYPEQGQIRGALMTEYEAKSCFDGERNKGVPGVFWP
jgi:hypothetical protein